MDRMMQTHIYTGQQGQKVIQLQRSDKDKDPVLA